MATIITPGETTTTTESTGVGFILGIILTIVIAILLVLYFTVPGFGRRAVAPTQSSAPAAGGQINVNLGGSTGGTAPAPAQSTAPATNGGY